MRASIPHVSDWSKRAFERSPVPTALVERDPVRGLVVAQASRSFEALVGSGGGTVTGQALTDLIELSVAGGSLCHPRGEPGRTLELQRADLGDGELIQLYDVGGRERPDGDLREQVRRLGDIIDNCNALIYVKDTEGRYILVNRQFEHHFGPREQVLGRTDFELFPVEIATAYTGNDRQVLATARPVQVEEPATAEPITMEEPGIEGAGRWLSVKFALLDERGEAYAVAGISTDITDRTRAEAVLQEAREEADRANRAKSEFLSRMSHELRTPLNAILGFGQLLELESLPDDARAAVDHILKAGRHLLTLINEVLDISRIEAGGGALTTAPVHACEPLKEALELVAPLADERGIEMAIDLHGGLHRYVLADRLRLKQVLLNLLGNAVKYNREGGVVRVRFDDRDPERLRFLVTDTGAGLRPAEAERAFLPFERLGVEEDVEGTGLGLALSRNLVEAMGGAIGVQHSAPGEGSTFFVELPLSDVEPVVGELGATPDAADGAPLPPATVLYVEDNGANVELVQRVLGRAGGVEVVAVGEGARAVEQAVRLAPDLVLLDLHLPDVTGAEVLARLKGDERTAAIPVIILSADATRAQIEALRTEGIVDYLTKPLVIAPFVGAVRRALERR